MENTDQLRAGARVVFQNFRKAIEITQDGLDVKKAMAKAKKPPETFKMSYWRFGCSFDTMTDYLWLLKNSKDVDDLKLYTDYRNFINDQSTKEWKDRVDPYAQYLKAMIQYNTSCCYDDFCWWGIASAKALEGSPYHELFLDIFGTEGAKTFQKMSTAIWQLVHHGNYQAVIDVTPSSYPGYDDFKANFEKRPDYHQGSPNTWNSVVINHPIGNKAAYSNLLGKATIKDLEPRFKNGMYQYDYYWDPTYIGTQSALEGTSEYKLGAAQETGCAQDGNPETTVHGIGPFQLTLISGLVMVYASRLQAWSSQENKDYLETATGIKGFLNDWFTLPDVPADASEQEKQEAEGHKLLWHYNTEDKDKMLVKERPGTYKDKTIVSGYLSKNGGTRLWSGDQGLILGALVEYEQATKTSSEDSYVESLIAGMLDTEGALFQKPSGNIPGSVQALYPSDTSWGEGQLFCLRDYWSGAGVFWRYLFQTYKSSPKVRTAIDAILAKDPKTNVIAQSAQAALENQKQPWTQNPWNNDDLDQGELFEWFNPLATLTAAIYILEA